MSILDTNYIDNSTLEIKNFLRGDIIAENEALFDAVDTELRNIIETNYHFIKDIRLDTNVNKNFHVPSSDFSVLLDKFASVYGARKIKDFYYTLGVAQLIYELFREVVLIIPATSGAQNNVGYSHNPSPPIFHRNDMATNNPFADDVGGNGFSFYSPIYDYYVRYISQFISDVEVTGNVLDIGEKLDQQRTLDFISGINEEFAIALNNASSNVFWVMKVVTVSEKKETSRDVDAFLFELFTQKLRRPADYPMFGTVIDFDYYKREYEDQDAQPVFYRGFIGDQTNGTDKPLFKDGDYDEDGTETYGGTTVTPGTTTPGTTTPPTTTTVEVETIEREDVDRYIQEVALTRDGTTHDFVGRIPPEDHEGNPFSATQYRVDVIVNDIIWHTSLPHSPFGFDTGRGAGRGTDDVVDWIEYTATQIIVHFHDGLDTRASVDVATMDVKIVFKTIDAIEKVRVLVTNTQGVFTFRMPNVVGDGTYFEPANLKMELYNIDRESGLVNLIARNVAGSIGEEVLDNEFLTNFGVSNNSSYDYGTGGYSTVLYDGLLGSQTYITGHDETDIYLELWFYTGVELGDAELHFERADITRVGGTIFRGSLPSTDNGFQYNYWQYRAELYRGHPDDQNVLLAVKLPQSNVWTNVSIFEQAPEGRYNTNLVERVEVTDGVNITVQFASSFFQDTGMGLGQTGSAWWIIFRHEQHVESYYAVPHSTSSPAGGGGVIGSELMEIRHILDVPFQEGSSYLQKEDVRPIVRWESPDETNESKFSDVFRTDNPNINFPQDIYDGLSRNADGTFSQVNRLNVSSGGGTGGDLSNRSVGTVQKTGYGGYYAITLSETIAMPFSPDGFDAREVRLNVRFDTGRSTAGGRAGGVRSTTVITEEEQTTPGTTTPGTTTPGTTTSTPNMHFYFNVTPEDKTRRHTFAYSVNIDAVTNDVQRVLVEGTNVYKAFALIHSSIWDDMRDRIEEAYSVSLWGFPDGLTASEGLALPEEQNGAVSLVGFRIGADTRYETNGPHLTTLAGSPITEHTDGEYSALMVSPYGRSYDDKQSFHINSKLISRDDDMRYMNIFVSYTNEL